MPTSKELIEEFEHTIGLAELKALSAVSLERQLSDQEFEKMMKLKKEVLGVD